MANSVVSTVNYAGDAANGYAAWVAAFKSRNTARGNAWLLAKADNIPNLSSDTTVYQYLGGFSGSSMTYLYSSVIAHSFIGGKADYVGGIASSINDTINKAAVIGVTVVGRNRVGGVGGAKTAGTLTYAAVNADVRGEDLVGGIVGDLGQNLTTAGGNTAYIRASYFAGNVTATAAGGRAAGIAANVSDPLAASSTGRQSYSNLVAAAINTPSGGTAAYFYNRVPADTAPLTSHVVFKGSKLNGASPAVDGSNIVGDANIYSQADLKTASKWYQSSLGTSFGTSYFNYGGLSKNDSPGAPYGYMPYVRDGGLLPYQNGRTANANGDGAYTYNAMPTVTNSTTLSQNPKGGIPIPAEDASDMPISTMSMRTISLMPQKLPKATIYAAGGASGLNAEFDAVNPETSLVIKTDSGLVLAETPIEERVYTFDWDFVTPLVMEVTDGHGAETYEANPRELRRSVMLWGDNYFYTDGLGIRDGEGRLLPGEFVNLRDGQGLTADGLLYDAVTGERLAGPSGPVTPRKTPSPLQSFTADGYDVESYMNFSVSESGGGEESITAMRLLYSKGETVGVTEGFSAAYDSVIFDTAGGESYLSVLDESGSIKDTMAALAKPSGFVNEGISHFANNLNSDLPYVLARYDDGRLDGFNYLTGEAPDFGNKGDLSLLEYAAEYFASAMSGTRNEAAEGYKDLKPLKEALTVFGPDKLIEGAAKLSANPEEGEEGGADGDGGEAADGAERGNERESASTAGTEETAASREAAPGPAEAGEGEGDGNTEVTPLGAVAANGTGVAVNAAGAGNGTATAVGSGTGDRRGEGLSEAPEEEAPYDGPGEEASISGAADEDETPVTDTAADGAEATGTGTAADEDEVIGTDTTADEAEAPAAGLSGATGAKGKTLAPPEKPERRSYTLVYDEKTGRYVFCDTRSMLAEGSVLPVLTATKEAGEAAAAMLAASSGTADAENPLRGGGAKALAVLFLASLLLLYACAVRRGRSG
jgi:hypothetical protein